MRDNSSLLASKSEFMPFYNITNAAFYLMSRRNSVVDSIN